LSQAVSHRGYPTEKPAAVSEVLIKQSTQAGEIILDPFMGSGSSGVASVKLGRHFIGCDSNLEAYELSNDLDKLLRMIELINNGVADLGLLLGLAPRQVKYYQHAALVLDLLNESYFITSRGKYLLTLPQVNDRYKVVMLLFESSPIGFAWLRYCQKQSVLDIDPDSAGDFLESRSSNLSSNTIGRRARTLRAWAMTFQSQ
jgi:hypothetical protein